MNAVGSTFFFFFFSSSFTFHQLRSVSYIIIFIFHSLYFFFCYKKKMTDNKGMARTYSQDRQIHRNNSISVTRKQSIQYSRTSENYYSNRNCPEILSLFALTNRRLDNRKNEIYNSISNDIHYLNMINYPIQSPPRTPMLNPQTENSLTETKFPKLTSSLNHLSENDDKQTKLSTVTPRVRTLKKKTLE